MAVFDRKTGKLIRIIFPHQNRIADFGRNVKLSAFLNMQTGIDDRIWVTFRYTNGLFIDGHKSSILINLNSKHIEKHVFGEVSGCYSDGSIEYLAMHKPDTAVGDGAL